MKIFFLTPGIKDRSQMSLIPQGLNAVFLSNPLFQDKILDWENSSLKVLREEDLNLPEPEELNKLAKRWATEWFTKPEIASALTYRGINLASLDTHAGIYQMTGILKALWLSKNLYAKFNCPEVFILDDGSYWRQALRLTANTRGIPARDFFGPEKPAKSQSSGAPKQFLKNILKLFYKPKLRALQQGRILFSCSLKYALPFLKEKAGDYYFRDVFSYKALKLSKDFGFAQLVPEYYSPGKSSYQSAGLMPLLDQHLPGFFSFEDLDAWPVIRPLIERWIQTKLPQAVKLIDQCHEIFSQLKPRAVYVDEDVCFFNKTLIRCADQFKIPSYAMLNGVPFFEIGNVPPSAGQVIVWGQSSRTRLEKWGVPSNGILEIGAAQYAGFPAIKHSECRAKVEQEFKIPSGKKLILLATQPFHTNERPDFFDTPLTPQTISLMLRNTLDYLKTDSEAYLIIKCHPGEKAMGFTLRILDEYPELSERIQLVRDYDTPTLIAASDLLLTIGSTVYFEALLLRRPAMLYDYPEKRYFEFMCPEFLDIRNSAQCVTLLQSFFKNHLAEAILKLQESRIPEHFMNGNTGAASRIASVLGYEAARG